MIVFFKIILHHAKIYEKLCRYLWFDTEQNELEIGQKNINILMPAVVYKGVAIPIYWAGQERQLQHA